MTQGASMIEQETLLNFVGGHWEARGRRPDDPGSTIRRPARCSPRAPLSSAADVDKAVRGGRERAAGVAPHAARRSHSAALPAQGAARRALRRDGALITQECGKTLAEVGRRAAARHRERRGRHRHPVADDGQQPRGHRLGHRRADDPPAGRRRRRDHAVQLSRHDPALVPAVRRRLRQHASSSSRPRRRR